MDNTSLEVMLNDFAAVQVDDWNILPVAQLQTCYAILAIQMQKIDQCAYKKLYIMFYLLF